MSNKYADSNQFIPGGGEMGKLIQEKDWGLTSLGEMQLWPQSLRTTLSIILNSRFPMFLYWGADLICFYNDAYRPSLGSNGKHPSILGMKAKEAWPETWHIIHPLITKVLQTGVPTWSEDQLIPFNRNNNIEDVYWTFSYSPVNDESRKPAGVFVTCTETTEKVLTVKELKESKEELQFAIEAAELGTFDYNPALNRFSANDHLREWFGLLPEAGIELHHAINVIDEEDREKVINAIKEALQFSSGGRYDVKYTIIHPVSKKETVVRARGRAWFNEKKIAYRLNGTLQDITEQKLFEQKLAREVVERTKELEEKNAELARINEELQSFTYISSHDLQEPLRKIQTFVTRIMDKEHDNLSNDAKDYFQRMRNAANRMQTLIDDLLAYSRTNVTEHNYHNTDLKALIEEVKEELMDDLQQKNATIEYGDMCSLNVIPFQFRQLLHNLIGNSLKFSKPGQPPLILIRSEIIENLDLQNTKLPGEVKYCHIIISDNGIGFEEIYNEKIFGLFQRLHSRHEYKGTGLGLAIVKKIVENHKGVITAKGELSKGATFDIYIPHID